MMDWVHACMCVSVSVCLSVSVNLFVSVCFYIQVCSCHRERAEAEKTHRSYEESIFNHLQKLEIPQP